jgi:hypothetical protein
MRCHPVRQPCPAGVQLLTELLSPQLIQLGMQAAVRRHLDPRARRLLDLATAQHAARSPPRRERPGVLYPAHARGGTARRLVVSGRSAIWWYIRIGTRCGGTGGMVVFTSLGRCLPT